MKLPASHQNRTSMTVFTTASHVSLTCATTTHSTYSDRFLEDSWQ